MKIIVIFSAILFLSTTYSFATEQFPDILIIENDTLYLKSFPLEELRLKEKLRNRPLNIMKILISLIQVVIEAMLRHGK